MPHLLRVMVAVLVVCAAPPAWADDFALCRAAISAAETSQRIPDAFLAAIARVESGRPDPQTGGLAAWPWTINAEGVGSFYATKAEAVEAVRALQARGVRSIDVGCLQINLLNHPEAFGSLEQAFDPAANASYASRFLISLFDKMGSWPLAAAAYHSQTPTIGAAYQRRVLAEWALPNQGAGPGGDSAGQPAGAHARPQAAPPGHQGTNGLQVAQADSLPVDARGAAASPAFGHAGSYVARIAPASSIVPIGRSLAAYRMMPTALALRMPRKSG